MSKTIVIVSGYFDPIHEGHIEYLMLAKKLGDKLIVIVNSDTQAFLKKGFSFMSQAARMQIVKSIRYVDEVVLSIDDDRSVSETLSMLAKEFRGDNLIFANGGDRFSDEIPEAYVCKKYNIRVVDGLGKKIQSSSSLINKARVN